MSSACKWVTATRPASSREIRTVRTDGQGERTFAYWRHGSASAVLLAGTSWAGSLDGDVIHLSGITVQLMTAPSREALGKRLALLRAQGSRVSLDTNYRPSGWPSAAVAARAISEVAGLRRRRPRDV